MEVATPIGLRPADFPIGSLQSRAAARSLIDQRDKSAMRDWSTVKIDDLKYARAFAAKLQSQDSVNPFKVRLIVKKHKTHEEAEAAWNQQSRPGEVFLTFVHDDEERAVKITRILAERHGGIVIEVHVSGERKSKV